MIPAGQSHCSLHLSQKRNRQADRQYDEWRKSNRSAGNRNQFYHSKQWKFMRNHVLDRDNSLCQYCELVDMIRPATIVDHVVPREVSRALELDMDNLVSCCFTCHNIKTSWEQEYYGTGQRNKINIDAVPIKSFKNLKFVFEK
jgi:5-methylcytosine-specific restriction endonuclease McrA